MENPEKATVINLADLMKEPIHTPEDRFGDPVHINGDPPAGDDPKPEDEPAGKDNDPLKVDDLNGNDDPPAGDDPKPEDEPTEQEIEASKVYTSSVKKLFGDDFVVTQIDEEGKEIEVPIDEIILDAASYTELVEEVSQQKEDEIRSGSISKDSISDFAKDLLEIEKLGGDVTQLLRTKATVTDPLDGMDLSTDEGKKSVIRLRYGITNTHTADEIEGFIRSFEAEGTLDDKAEASEAELRKAVEEHQKAVKKQAEDDLKERKELLKGYKNDVKSFVDKMDLADNIKRNIIKKATAQNDKGHFDIDQEYFKARANPEVGAELALYLLDRELFHKYQTNKAVQKEKQKRASKYRYIPSAGGSGTKTKKKSDIGKDSNIIDLSSLND